MKSQVVLGIEPRRTETEAETDDGQKINPTGFEPPTVCVCVCVGGGTLLLSSRREGEGEGDSFLPVSSLVRQDAKVRLSYS